MPERRLLESDWQRFRSPRIVGYGTPLPRTIDEMRRVYFAGALAACHRILAAKDGDEMRIANALVEELCHEATRR